MRLLRYSGEFIYSKSPFYQEVYRIIRYPSEFKGYNVKNADFCIDFFKKTP